jgi:Na+-translocating membrane potential-generating system (MpsC)
MPDRAAQPSQRQRDGAARTAISDGMVALLKDFYGVGPAQTKTYYHDDLVVCLMRGGFTRVEQTDAARGRPNRRDHPAADGIPRSHAPPLRGGHRASHRPARGRLHERQPARPRHDLRGLRAHTHRPHRRRRTKSRPPPLTNGPPLRARGRDGGQLPRPALSMTWLRSCCVPRGRGTLACERAFVTGLAKA